MPRQATLKDIATRAEVSVQTVSLVLKGEGRISKQTRDRVLRIARDLSYKPNMMAKGLVGSRTYLLGALFPYLDLSFVNVIIAGMERRCVELGYEILLCGSSSQDMSLFAKDLGLERAAVRRMLQRSVDGIVCLPDPRAYEIYEEARAGGIPVLQVLRSVPGLQAPSLRVDNEEGSFLATRELLRLGHETIGFLNHPDPLFTEVASRQRGYLRALAASGIRQDPEALTEASDLTFEGGRRAALALLRRVPALTALVCPTDYAALGAMRACEESGRRVPEDVSVIGFDDLEIARYQAGRPLSTVRQPQERLGELAVDMLMGLIAGEEVPSRELTPELVLRETTGPRG